MANEASRRTPGGAPRAPRLAFALGVLAALAAGGSRAELPVPCAPCAGGVNFTLPGTPSTYTVSGRNGVVQQALERETFNWASFDIGHGYSMEFRQPAATSIALNRIYDASPSEIFGALRANGQIYLVNQNGILFRAGAQVDVNTLLASSLDLNAAVADLFETVGVANAFAQAGNPAALSANGDPDPGPVVVEAGARIRAQKNGRAILVGSEVRNAGTIEVSGIGGQALLIAAKDKVYVLLSQESGVRGLAVELDGGGTVENIGQVLAESGNITLAGLAVNQRGVLRATTAVAANGTIRLQARDTVGIVGGTTPIANRAGSVEFGAGSRTEILPDTTSAATAADDLAQLQSSIHVSGQDITLRRAAELRAPGGSVSLRASAAPNPTLQSGIGTIRMEAGSRIDVAGRDAGTVPASRNVVTVETRGNELADAPVQRDGPLFGATIQFDVRHQPGIANVAAAAATIQRGVLERTASGGSIAFEAGQRVEIERDAVLDVSGGVLRYSAGLLETTRLIKDGVIVDIAHADKAIRYDGLLGPVEFVHAKWGPTATEWFRPFGPVALSHFQQAYVEGKDAGRITIRSLAANPAGTPLVGDIAGTFRAATVRGFYQREPGGARGGLARPWTEIPFGGALELLANSGSLTYEAASAWPFVLDGLAHLHLSVDSFVLPEAAALAMPAGGSLAVDALSLARIDGRIRIPGGDVALRVNDDFVLPEGVLNLGPNAAIDVSGVLVNDGILLNPRGNDAPLFVDGGAITLFSGGRLSTASGSMLDVNGGLLLDTEGRYVPGNGGRLELTVAQLETALARPTLELRATLSGFVFPAYSGIFADGVGARSRLVLGAESVTVGANGTTIDPHELRLDPARLLASGFTDIELHGHGGTVRVDPGTVLRLEPQYLALDGVTGAASAARRAQVPSTDDVGAIASPVTVAEAHFRSPTSLTLDADPFVSLVRPSGGVVLPPALALGAGSVIETEAGGAVRLHATGSIDLRGILRAPAGTIDIAITPFIADDGAADPTVGFDPARAVTLHAGGRLDVAGVTVADPLALTAGAIVDAGQVTRIPGAAGTIAISAAEAFIVAAPGATLDVSAATGVAPMLGIDLFGAPRVTALPLSGQAGSIALTSSNGIQLYADLHGRPAPGGAGGSLALNLDGGLRKANNALAAGVTPFPESALSVRIGSGAFPVASPGGLLAASLFGRADFDPGRFAASGLDYLRLSAAPGLLQRGPNTTPGLPLIESRIDILGDVSLDVRGGLTLDAPLIVSDGGSAALRAGHLEIGFQRADYVTSDSPLPGSSTEPAIKFYSASGGSGRLSFTADHIDLVGFSAFRGLGGDDAALAFTSTGDLRLVGVQSPEQVPSAGIDGALVVSADIRLQAARIYPTTLTDFRILNQAANGSVTFAGGSNRITPASAAGRIGVTAPRIAQFGALFAPHGQITLDADAALVLGTGSLTSVSGGDATILFGRTQVGDWIYPLANGAFVFDVAPDASRNEFLPPAKRVDLIADGTAGGVPTGVVDIRPGAVIDLLGGGTLLASEFVPGPGGTIDLLDAGTAIDLPGLESGLARFALVPAERGMAPFDPLEFRHFDLAPGTQVRLHQAVGALPAGVYAVLPPRYALLPDAYLLTRAPGVDGLPVSAGTRRAMSTAEGLPLVMASIENFGIAADVEAPLYQYQVETGAELRLRAEYLESTADAYFSAQAAARAVSTPLLPVDAGALVLRPTADLLLGGRLATGVAAGGLGTRVDIAAADIFISTTGTGGGGVDIRAADLETLDADSLFIGGTRAVSAGATTIEQIFADSVIVDDGVRLTLPELTLAALERVEIGDGAAIAARGRVPTATGTLLLHGDGALVRLSTQGLPNLIRTGIPSGSTAVAALGAGASLVGHGSLIVDSAGATILDGEFGAGAGGGIRLGAERIALGLPPSTAPGLALDAGRLAGLGVAELVLASVEALDLYGGFALDLDALVIDAPGLRGQRYVDATGTVDADALIAARTIVLTNGAGRQSGTSGAGEGSLRLVASERLLFATTAALDLLLADDGDFDVTGFDSVGFTAPALLANATHSASIDADLDLTAGVIGALNGGSLALHSTGALTTSVGIGSGAALPGDLELLGGRISLDGASLAHRGRIVTPSGSTRLAASAGDLLVDGVVSAAGLSALDFVFVDLGTPGGRIELAAANGDIEIGAAAVLGVDGGSGRWQADAGAISFALAHGGVSIDPAARLSGGAGGGAMSGALELDAQSFAAIDLAALNETLDGGGFFGRRHFRVRGPDDLVIDAATRIKAQDIELVADQGDVVIAGTLDASGWRAGHIDVVGGNGVEVLAGAALSARAQGGYVPDPRAPTEYSDGFRGGQIELGAPDGTVTLAGGTFDVRGTRVAADGSLIDDASGVLRFTAARNVANNGLAMSAVGSTLVGARDIQLVGHKAYDAAGTGAVVADASTFSAAGSTIRGALGLGAVANVRVVPGIEIFSTGDLTASVPGTTSPTTGLFANTVGAGVLSFRAGGNLNLAANASIRDGILTQTLNGQGRFIADTAHSWTLNFVAGAELASPDLLATGSTGNLTLGNGASIMTGNGDINLAAGGNISLGTDAKVLVVGRHFTTAENGGLYDFDGTINIPTTFLAQFQFLRGVSFPDFGGHLRIAAGGDLTGAGSTQFVSNWHVRMGGRNRSGAGVIPSGTVPQAWGLSIGPAAPAANATTGLFNQGLAAWGGGDIDIDVGGDIERLQLSIPTVGRQVGSNTWTQFNQPWVTTSNVVDEIGGGVARVSAGGSIRGLDAFVARGEAEIKAGGDIVSTGSGANDRHVRVALGDAEIRLSAGGRVDLSTVINHTGLSLPSTHPVPLGGIPFELAYMTYALRSAIQVSALGDVSISNRTGLAAQNALLQNLYPAKLEILSGRGDVLLSGNMNLFSNAQDGFVIAAAGDIRSSGTLGSLLQVDVLRSTFPSLSSPALPTQLDVLFGNLGGHSPQPVYAGNREPNVMVARDGLVTGLSVTTAKRLLLYAGDDLFNPQFEIQHVNPGDVSVFQAGNDILMPAGRSPSGLLTTAAAFIEIAGPGEAQFIAGGDIDLGTAGGILSVGDTRNPALPDQGADLSLIAGIGDDLGGLLDFAIQNYLVDVLLPFVEIGTLAGDGIGGPVMTVLPEERRDDGIAGISAADWDDGLARRDARRENLARYLNTLASRGLASADAATDEVARLRALDDTLKLGFLLDLLYDELTFSGIEGILGYDGAYSALSARNVTAGVELLELGRKVAVPASGEDDGRRGYAAIEAFFPSMRYAGATSAGFEQLAFAYDGDLSSTLSTVQTQDGGSIRTAVPGGRIDAGATQNDAIAKADKDLGYIVFRSGDMKSFVHGNFNVNSTRVFAQNGGDILIWSSFGDIDAGRGAKTAATLPATSATFDEFGNFVDEPPLEVAGSGIRNFAPAGVTPGSLFLFARAGVINAGDAGIGTAGNAFVDANEFQNFTNTDFGGDVAGFSTDVGGISLSLASVGDVAASAAKATDKATADAAERDAAAQAAGAFQSPAMSIISVEVLGFGG